MDTTYIKMCDCEEIQKLWKPAEGDVVVNYEKGRNVPYPYIYAGHSWDGDIWLPRQDQLQEMIQEYRRIEWYEGSKCLTEPLVMLDDFTSWVLEGDDVDWVHKQEDVSMNQLWLAFCMSEKYNKYWDGEQWQLEKS